MSGLSGSYSGIHSLVEGSEAISEADEIQEVKHLQKRGDKAFHGRNFSEALRCYNDALEIDEQNISALASRAAVFIEMGNYILAQHDAEKLLSFSSEQAQGHYLLGVSLDNLGQYREALNAFLNALDLDTDPSHADVLASHIASTAQTFCVMPENLVDNLNDMDPYNKLCEVGMCLYQDNRNAQCIKVLNAAEKVATNQKGITMKVQLTLANAHSALKHTDLAISLYQECFATALSTHDYQYQTKALVNIASLFLELGDTHRAIINYEKLLALEKEIRGEQENASLPVYWTQDLQCALHLNLSIAYKSIGSMEYAVHYARAYTKLAEEFGTSLNVQAQSYHNEGLLNEILGDYTKAVESYKNYLTQSKKAGDKRGVAQAYGCLGSAYAALGNYQLSVTYHEQHVSLASKLEDSKLVGLAHEQYGDSRFVFNEFQEAIDCYMNTIKLGARNDLRLQTSALCKIGKTYKALNRLQYSIYYFEQAKIIAEDFEFHEIKQLCEYNLACILESSTQVFEIDQAEKYFNRLIPIYEAKIHQHREEDTFCPKDLVEQLENCYLGIIRIYVKSGNRDDALVYSECMRKKQAALLVQSKVPRSQSLLSLASTREAGTMDTWNIGKLLRVVADQNAAVVYYTMLPTFLVVWVLLPGEGIVRFYTSKQMLSSEGSVGEKISKLMKQLFKNRNVKELVYDCENRALPERNTDMKLIKKANQKLRMSDNEELDATSDNAASIKGNHLTTAGATKSEDSQANIKGPDRALFDILLAPVYDILSKLEPGSPVMIVPDKELLACPFGIIRDWNQVLLKDRFRITVIPSLLLLDKVMQNELQQLKVEDDIEFDRTKSQMGGMHRITSSMECEARKTPAFNFAPRFQTSESYYSNRGSETLDSRRVSNPRLAQCTKSTTNETKTESKKRELYFAPTNATSKMSLTGLKASMSRPVPPTPRTLPLKSIKPMGEPTKTERLLRTHTMTTLTTKTSTNTDIVKTDCGVAEYKQVSDPEKCFIIGSPSLPETVMLYGSEWQPRRDMKSSQKECFKVAEILGAHAVVGKEARKDQFLKGIQEATIVHIATMANLEDGLVVMSPCEKRHEQGSPLEHSYLVTASEIADLSLVAKLVVLSVGWSTSASRETTPAHLYHLPTAFLAAGAQCVLTLLWAVPNAALDKFYFHFYQTLQEGGHVTTAATIAGNFLRDENRYEDLSYWAPFIVIGKDVELDLQHVKHAMLDQLIDEVEKGVAEELDSPPLNPKPRIPDVPTLEENLREVQRFFGELMLQHMHQKTVIPELIGLLDGALKRLHLKENNQRPVQLPECVAKTEAGLKLLKLLGFHFQGKGSSLTDPYVIYPHWNPDSLLIPTYDALRAAIDITSSPGFSRALFEFLPSGQEMLSYLIDVISIAKHAPEIQLKVSDLSVRPLWKNPKVKAILLSMGFHQVGPLLTFNCTPSSMRLMNASLQFLIAVSAYKSSTLLHKLDVTLLGGPNSLAKSSDITFERVKLPSLTPVVLPRNQLLVATPWLSAVETAAEMDEKMRLAQGKADLASDYRSSHQRAKTWHHLTLVPQAKESLDQFGRPRTQQAKVKVQSGSTTSSQRLPVELTPRLTIQDTDQRRDYANYVLHQRLGNISLRHKNDIRKAYLPYVENPCPTY